MSTKAPGCKESHVVPRAIVEGASPVHIRNCSFMVSKMGWSIRMTTCSSRP